MNKRTVFSILLAFVVLIGAFWFYFNHSVVDSDLDIAGLDCMDDADCFNVNVEEARGLIDSTNIMVIDVSADYPSGRIPNSVWYNYFDETINWAVPLLDKNGSYLIYSHDDDSAINAVNLFVDAGFVSVYRLEGGFSAWESAGEEIEL
jgi:rhodanese-related sulfurtransferase